MIKEFKLSNKEYENACEFEKDHIHKEVYTGAIGGGLRISFYPNGIRYVVKIKCDICGEEKNITDYDCW